MSREDTKFEIGFFEALIKERPDFVDALKPLAELYTTAGDYKKGLIMDKRLACLLPDDPVVHYNLACSLALVGKPDEAIQTLQRAVALGYDEFGHMTFGQAAVGRSVGRHGAVGAVKRDPDLKTLRTDARFQKLFPAKKA